MSKLLQRRIKFLPDDGGISCVVLGEAFVGFVYLPFPLCFFGSGGDSLGASSGEGHGWILVLLVDEAPGVVDGVEILLPWVEILLLCGGFGEFFSGHRVRFVISLFTAKEGMIWASRWDVPSGLSISVAPALGWWAFGPEEDDGVLGVLPLLPAWVLLMCHSEARWVREGDPWRWLMQRVQELELLDGEAELPKLGDAGGGRRCSLRKKAEKISLACVVIFISLRVFFVIWGCIVLQF